MNPVSIGDNDVIFVSAPTRTTLGKLRDVGEIERVAMATLSSLAMLTIIQSVYARIGCATKRGGIGCEGK